MQFQELSEIFDKYKSDKDIFHDLMQTKAREILLVSTLYDAFILEQEGQLSEQIFGEYYQLNLSSAPRITSVSTPEKALRKLSNRHFDMVILMAGIDAKAQIALSNEIRKVDPDIPVILLLNNNSNISFFQSECSEIANIDKIFVWNGYSKIFLAMTKYVEDKCNVRKDTEIGMVRVILLVEDSIRYYSRYLPVLYTEIMKQTQRLISEESYDEKNKILRMRARPKVLLVSTYEEAVEIFEEYRDYLLCVISDVKYCREGKVDPEAGLKFIDYVKDKCPDLPTLLQSSDLENQEKAYNMGSSFLNKNSDSLSMDLRNFILDNLGFGQFVFRNAVGRKIATAQNMDEFEVMLRNIPDESLVYHGTRNHFSAWLMARGEIQFARILRPTRVSDFSSPHLMREYIITILEKLHHLKTRGKIVNFDKNIIRKASHILRLSNGSLGGKARGIAFTNNLIEHVDFTADLENIKVKIPVTAIIGTDEFEQFMEGNEFQDIIYMEEDYEKIKELFLNCNLSEKLMERLRSFLWLVKKPIAVRSSGLFEDMLLQPFAGIYDTFLLPNSHPDPEVRLKSLSDAIKLIFASVFSKKARVYFEAVNYKIEEERMAIILQEVVGEISENTLYPHMSGIAQSHNYYPVSYLKPEEGIAVLGVGLGTYVVDGEQAFRFCPKYPKLDIVAPEHQLKSSQRYFYAIDLEKSQPNLMEGESACYTKMDIAAAEKHGRLHHIASTMDLQNNRIQPGISQKGVRIINFANIIKYNSYPVSAVIERILDVGEKSLGTPVEIEFAVDLTPDRNGKAAFYILQLKPLLQNAEECLIDTEAVEKEKLLLYTDRAMGNGRNEEVRDIIFVDPEKFDKSKTMEMSAEIENLNAMMKEKKRKYVLIGPGRWGTRDRWLGIPVGFLQISNAQVMVEVGLKDYQIDASLGSHFFHNITSMNIGYFTIPFHSSESFVDWEWLKSIEPANKTEYFIHVELPAPISIVMDGKKGVAMIEKSCREV